MKNEMTGRPLKILIVDDNEDSARTLGWMMEALGHEATVVNDGRDALAVTKSFAPEVVLLDIGLPGMSGYEVCETMKKNPAMANVLFVAQTGWGQPEHRKRSKEAGFHHHLVKPVDLGDLQKILEELQRSGQARPASREAV